jgi:hypothetical protein
MWKDSNSLLIEIKARFAAQRGRRGRHGKDNFWNDSGDSGQVYFDFKAH